MGTTSDESNNGGSKQEGEEVREFDVLLLLVLNCSKVLFFLLGARPLAPSLGRAAAAGYGHHQ